VHRFNLNFYELTLPRTDNNRSNLENIEYFSCLVNLMIKDARSAKEITQDLPKKMLPSTRRRLSSPANMTEI